MIIQVSLELTNGDWKNQNYKNNENYPNGSSKENHIGSFKRIYVLASEGKLKTYLRSGRKFVLYVT